MTGDTINVEDGKQSPTQTPSEAKEKRTISTIEFPYNDLETAIGVARAVNQRTGTGPCGFIELAVQMNHEANSGTFRLKVTAARMFGLVAVDRSVATLTDLGRRIIDGTADQHPTELADALLSVELYRALYRKYEGYTLPPAAALEREIVALGVSEKQKDKARQAFDRSAKYANFIAPNGRLIRPASSQRGETASASPEMPDQEVNIAESAAERRSIGGGGSGGGPFDGFHLDPLIAGLLTRLPPPDRSWPIRERARWLQALAVNLGIIYAPDDSDQIDVIVRSEAP